MSSPALFREVFTDATTVPAETLSDWFDAKTARFGGQDVLAAVQALVGNCTRFDFQEASQQIPRLDLPDLKPFFKAMLYLNKRKVQEESGGLTFLTPESWAAFPGARREYEGMVFERGGKDPQRVLGVGHRLVNQALVQACGSAASVAAVPDVVLEFPLYVYRVTDRVTSGGGQVRSVTVAVEAQPSAYTLLRDWQLVLRLNQILAARDPRRFKGQAAVDPDAVRRDVEAAGRWLNDRLPELDVPFRVPVVNFCCLLLPSRRNALDGDNPDNALDEIAVTE
jgi:hypothetical protein